MEKIKEIMEKADGVFNVIGGSMTLITGICIGVCTLLYGRKKLKSKE